MKKTYELFKKTFPLILTGCALSAFFGVLSIWLYYKEDTFVLEFPRVISVIFIALVFLSVIGVGVFSFMCKDITVTSIRKKGSSILTLASVICVIVMLMFLTLSLVDIIKNSDEFFELIDRSKKSTHGLKFAVVYPYIQPIVMAFSSIFLCAYFVVMALPEKIGNKEIKIPNVTKKILSVCAILHPILALFSVYFSKMTSTSYFKTTQILVYSAFSLFFLFETEFEHLAPRHKPYILSSLLSTVFAFSFSLSTVIYRLLSSNVKDGFPSDIDILCATAIGFYAFARFISLFRTIKFENENPQEIAEAISTDDKDDSQDETTEADNTTVSDN